MAKEKAPQEDVFDRLINQYEEDFQALKEQDELIEKAKSYRSEIQLRLRDMRKDLVTLAKYATTEQKEKIQSFDLETASGNGRGGALNPFSDFALSALMEADGNALTNEQLHNQYLDTVPDNEEAVDYTQFNIKLRQLYDRGQIQRDQIDPNKKSREDIIRLVSASM